MIMDLNRIYNEDCLEGMKRLPDASVDCILTDPPYLYLKHKLDRPFDERRLFGEFKRVLKPKGFVVLFGRGTSFYRWNTELSNLGFDFKEEIIWDKSFTSSPLLSLSRVHETISVHTLRGGRINKVRVQYIEMKAGDIPSICADIRRMREIIRKPEVLDVVNRYLTTGEIALHKKMPTSITIQNNIRSKNRSMSVVQAMTEGLIEKSIIRNVADRYTSIHPTQKPVRLLERLLALTSHPGDVVLDPFAGSCSTAVACINTARKYIGFEIDREYYNAGVSRLNALSPD